MPTMTQEDLRDIVGQIGEGVDSDTVFGETRYFEKKALIPVAKVRYAGGGGFGEGEQKGEKPESQGMGMGFSVAAKPIGFIEVTEKDVVYRSLPAEKSMMRSAILALVAAVGATAASVMASRMTGSRAMRTVGKRARSYRTRAAMGIGQVRGQLMERRRAAERMRQMMQQQAGE